MAIKPSTKPDWMLGYTGPRVVEPTLGKKQLGWAVDERPPSEFFNFLFQSTSEWIEYLDQISLAIDAFNAIYQAIVGTGPLATHATLNEAMADSNVGPNARILVISDLTLSVTQQITKNGCQIEFMPGVTIFRGVAPIGLQITATRVKVVGARFAQFNTMGDVALKIDPGQLYNRVIDCNFNDCDTEVLDDGVSTVQYGNITE